MNGIVVAERPVAGAPRPYAFPSFRRSRLANGLSILAVDLPGRPLLAVSLLFPGGAADEPAELAGATVLMARAITEGTASHDAISLVEATERLGASLHAEAGWDSFAISLDIPAERLAAGLDLMAEVAATPTFPEAEVERLREERLNDILQARADPRRRAEEAFIEQVYAPSSPYHRSIAGTAETVARLDAQACRAELARRFDPAAMTVVIGGDLAGHDVDQLLAERLGGWTADPSAAAPRPTDDSALASGRRVHVVHRPGAVQTEIRIGHPGVPRKIDDFHALSVMGAVLGGLFNSRLNRVLREEKGYTYGAHAGFDLRRSAGPFAARAAVDTANTVPSIVETLAVLEAIRDGITEAELKEARDYLVGVFPLRFETADAVAAALGALVVQGLPDDELARYRPQIEAVTLEAVAAAARARIHPEDFAVVCVGDADAFLPALEAAGIGPITVEREPEPLPSESLDDIGPA